MKLIACLLLIPALSFAQVPHRFQNGEVADAKSVNANFQSLDGRIQAIEDASGVEAAARSMRCLSPGGVSSLSPCTV